MLNCKDTCSSKTIKMGADVKEDKQMILKNLIQEIYNLLESLLEARQDPLGCLNSWIMRTIQFILKFTNIQKAEELSCFHSPCQDWCSSAQTDVLRNFRCDGVFWLSSAGSPGNHSPGVVDVSRELQIICQLLGLPVLSGMLLARPGTHLGSWAELAPDCFSAVENTLV